MEEVKPIVNGKYDIEYQYVSKLIAVFAIREFQQKERKRFVLYRIAFLE